MPSQLVNLLRVLAWSDYPQHHSPAPGPGQTAFAAQTSTNINLSGFAVDPIPGSTSVRLRDNITVTIEFVRHQSWVENWVFSKPQAYQDDLLVHEQGHFKLAGLLARDAFLAMMRMKVNSYASSSALQADLNVIQTNILGKATALDQKYETDTDHGMVAAQQTSWNGFIQKGFTTPATPAETTPDGIVVKIPILTILSQNGITL
jgi:hypothetical protein